MTITLILKIALLLNNNFKPTALNRIHQKDSLTICNKKICSDNPESKQFFIINVNNEIQKRDTLFVLSINNKCLLIWRSDTIAEELAYSEPTDFISNLGALGAPNTFILKCFEGDQCPTMYKLLEFKNDSNYFLSEPFGNCEELSSIKINLFEIEFQFKDYKALRRMKATYLYDKKKFTIKFLKRND